MGSDLELECNERCNILEMMIIKIFGWLWFG